MSMVRHAPTTTRATGESHRGYAAGRHRPADRVLDRRVGALRRRRRAPAHSHERRLPFVLVLLTSPSNCFGDRLLLALDHDPIVVTQLAVLGMPVPVVQGAAVERAGPLGQPHPLLARRLLTRRAVERPLGPKTDPRSLVDGPYLKIRTCPVPGCEPFFRPAERYRPHPAAARPL